MKFGLLMNQTGRGIIQRLFSSEKEINMNFHFILFRLHHLKTEANFFKTIFDCNEMGEIYRRRVFSYP